MLTRRLVKWWPENAILIYMSVMILAIDYGLQRVGFAYGSMAVGLVSERGTWSNDPTLYDNIRKLVTQQTIGLIIVGLPRGLDGQDTPQTTISREFADSLGGLGVKVELRDEAGTSELAKQRLAADAPKAAVDAEAAAIILQEYLDEV